MQVTFDYSKTAPFISEDEIKNMKKLALDAKEVLVSRTGAGNDFLGWIDLPVNYDKEEFSRIKKAAAKIQSDSEVLLVIGIGGSYLGARAAIEFLKNNFYNCMSKEERKTPEIYFVGNNISTTYMNDLIALLKGKDFSINVISKSGTTTEPAIAFRILKKVLTEKYGGWQSDLRGEGRHTDRHESAPEGKGCSLSAQQGYQGRSLRDVGSTGARQAVP